MFLNAKKSLKSLIFRYKNIFFQFINKKAKKNCYKLQVKVNTKSIYNKPRRGKETGVM